VFLVVLFVAELSIAHRKFAQTLEEFQFETNGTPTDDERDIGLLHS
jgi:hypothetical protein